MNARSRESTIERATPSVYVVPTDTPCESDGTLTWSHTAIVIVVVSCGQNYGLGYTYASPAAARVIQDVLAPAIEGLDPMAIPSASEAMRRAVRNVGQPGIAFHAISAVDIALWDLKAKLLGVSLVTLLGAARDRVVAYGSGGFTSYADDQLCAQLRGWVEAGCAAVKMKIGRDAERDRERVRSARRAIGSGPKLFVDANGAYDRKLALLQALHFSEQGVRWFEEPVSSDDLAGLSALRAQMPPGVDVAAGEYGDTPVYFERMLSAEAVDVLQIDATRCGGVTGFLAAAALAAARSLDVSAHCAPALHMHLGCATPRLRHLEYFHDHARIESMFFDGAPSLIDGTLAPDRSRLGLGLSLRTKDVARFAIS
ncbi:MAG TPA: enolase C-terminal domain-like protein [Polyangiales bacterium]|jgi:L-alanine-DL-glutamate epimerase-like enolase superfamily enzyme